MLAQTVVPVIALAAPVDARRALALLPQLHTLERIVHELLEARAVHDVAYVLLALGCIRIDVLLDEGVGVLHDLDDGVLVHPTHEAPVKPPNRLSFLSW